MIKMNNVNPSSRSAPVFSSGFLGAIKSLKTLLFVSFLSLIPSLSACMFWKPGGNDSAVAQDGGKDSGDARIDGLKLDYSLKKEAAIDQSPKPELSFGDAWRDLVDQSKQDSSKKPESGIDTGKTDQIISDTSVKTDTTPAWTSCYYGSAYPENESWTEHAPTTSGWTTKLISSGILELSTINSNESGYYEKAVISLSDATGWIVEGQVQLGNSEGSGACQIQVQDDLHNVTLSIENSRIVEIYSNKSFTMQPGSKSIKYQIRKKSGYFEVYVDGTLRLSGSAASNPGTGSIIFHDPVGAFDSDAFWKQLCYYDQGNSLP